MPLPTPRNTDNETTFIRRCLTDETLWDEYDDDKQIRAVCQTIWDDYEKQQDSDYQTGKTQVNLYSVKSNTEIKDVDNNKREVAIYLSKFGNLDSDNDVIQKGAFKKSLKERGVNSTGNRKIQFLRHHDWTKQIGTFTTLQEDENGLFAVGKLGTSTLGEDAWRDYNEGIIREHSIGYQLVTGKSKWIKDDTIKGGGYNLISEVVLFEGSAVTFGANELTPTVGIVKTLEEKNNYINEISQELTYVIGAIAAGKGSDERQYALEMKAKFLSSQLTLLAAQQPFEENTVEESVSMVEKGLDWNYIFSKINK